MAVMGNTCRNGTLYLRAMASSREYEVTFLFKCLFFVIPGVLLDVFC